MKDEHGPVLGPQPAEAAIERVAVLDASCRIRVARDVRGPRPFVRTGVARAPPRDRRDRDQHPMQPGVEPVGVSKPLQVAPGEDERLLDRVVGEVAVAEHELGDVEQAADRIGREGRERVAVAPACLSRPGLAASARLSSPGRHAPVSH